MTTFSGFLHRFAAPFMMGACLAAATAGGVLATVAFVIAGIAIGMYGFPAGRRMIDRLALVPA